MKANELREMQTLSLIHIYFRGVCPILEPGERITDSDGIRALGEPINCSTQFRVFLDLAL